MTYATRLNNLAGVIKEQGRYEEAEEIYRQALKISNRLLGPEHPYTYQAFLSFASSNLPLIRTMLKGEVRMIGVGIITSGDKKCPNFRTQITWYLSER